MEEGVGSNGEGEVMRSLIATLLGLLSTFVFINKMT